MGSRRHRPVLPGRRAGAELDAGRCGRAPGSVDMRRFGESFILLRRETPSILD